MNLKRAATHALQISHRLLLSKQLWARRLKGLDFFIKRTVSTEINFMGRNENKNKQTNKTRQTNQPSKTKTRKIIRQMLLTYKTVSPTGSVNRFLVFTVVSKERHFDSIVLVVFREL